MNSAPGLLAARAGGGDADPHTSASAARTKLASKRLLRRLAEGRGKIVSHDALAFALYGDNPDGGPDDVVKVIAVLIHRLRKHLGPDSIGNQWGVGYCLRADLAETYLAQVDEAEVVLALTPRDEAAFRALRGAA